MFQVPLYKQLLCHLCPVALEHSRLIKQLFSADTCLGAIQVLLTAITLMGFLSSVAASVLHGSSVPQAKQGIRQRRSAGGC